MLGSILLTAALLTTSANANALDGLLHEHGCHRTLFEADRAGARLERELTRPACVPREALDAFGQKQMLENNAAAERCVQLSCDLCPSFFALAAVEEPAEAGRNPASPQKPRKP